MTEDANATIIPQPQPTQMELPVPVPIPTKPCAEPGCTEPILAGALCGKHYRAARRWRRKMSTTEQRNLLSACVDECGMIFDQNADNISALCTVLGWEKRRVISGLYVLQEVGLIQCERRRGKLAPRRWTIIESAQTEAIG